MRYNWDFNELRDNRDELRRRLILTQDADEANEIREDAKLQAEEECKQVIGNAKEDVAKLVMNLAENILDREITDEENSKIIEKALKEWSEENA